MRRFVFGLGSAQFLLSAAAIAGGILAIGIDPKIALVAGMALALSSTAVVTQILVERRRLALPVGRATVAVLIFQDLMVVPIVIAVGILAGAEMATGGALLRALLFAAVAVGAIVLAGRFLIRPLLRLAVLRGNRDLFVAIALLIAFGASLITASVGLSAALGAFLAGLLLSASEYRHQLEVDVDPFKGLLLGLFFMTVGMGFDIRAVLAAPFPFLAALAALILVKIAIVLLAGRVFRLSDGVSLESAFLLAGVGEFAFVAFTLASREGLLDAEAFAFLISLSTLGMLVIPLLGEAGRRLGRRRTQKGAATELGVHDGDGDDLADHVVIGGFGRVGRTVARLLDEERIPYVGLDMDPDLVSEQRAAGHSVYLGDAARLEMLERVGGARALAFVVTTNNPAASESMVRAVRAAWPDAVVHARAVDTAHAARLREIGVADVIPETLEGSLQLAGQVLMRLGIPDDAVDDRLDALRREETSAAAIARPGQASPQPPAPPSS
jgi:CPA2 family monovalent cation:H+ antiporter-2